MYQADAPHGVTASAVPTDTKSKTRKFVELTKLKNGTEKLNLLNEALARARMRDLWVEEHRHKPRGSRRIMIEAHRRQRKH